MAEGRFAGLVVQITGAGSGFGAEAALRFAAEGAKLALSDRNGAALESVAGALGKDVLAEAVDVTDEAAIERHVAATLDRFGQLDIAINNAGIGQTLKPLTMISAAEFDRIMAVNARGVFFGMKHQIPPMRAARRGTILNIASAAGLVGAGQLAAYAASKHAVVGLTRAAADEVAKRGIRVNAICPSFAVTPLFDEMADGVGARHDIERSEAYARIAGRVPMGRVAEVGEVVQAMLWACDPANSFMTGQAIPIDGGLTAI